MKFTELSTDIHIEAERSTSRQHDNENLLSLVKRPQTAMYQCFSAERTLGWILPVVDEPDLLAADAIHSASLGFHYESFQRTCHPHTEARDGSR